MGDCWYKIDVYNYDLFVGSFYTDSINNSHVRAKINAKFGVANWTHFNVD